ncbi:hypothetical protein SJAG_04296 [Schizosaccharomyces japonicus yFS275]|uniref:Amino acid permease/ SLC12A domain-containing protein n=1 Tax=Schizosaccharomyces japonicus (strain yFS275 / FY16936) TaxID=402676 RepID=B6K6G5_SCHJY|nr:hypothetical protein SJAG_04296 [Schizosaccharomyces japonicus yFS275]EEB09119.1 hypothetical protein SJAG_04296 [Schizosaccharomyces japonicus yFS275]
MNEQTSLLENSENDNDSSRKLLRSLTQRQIFMLTLGGTLGTGLFLGTGSALANAGPASMVLSYCSSGLIVYLTILALGEMTVYLPVAGSFCTFASRFVDDAFGFALTWNYWLNDAVSVANNVLAVKLLVWYWIEKPKSMSESIFGNGSSALAFLSMICLNLLPVHHFAEFEYWLSLIKLLTVGLFNIVGILVNLGLNYKRNRIAFRYWKDPGAFNNGMLGFASSFVSAAFTYGGIESIALTSGEAANPRRSITRTLRYTGQRLLGLYVLTSLVLSLDIPYDTPGLNERTVHHSPFTLVFQLAGFNKAASCLNFVILSSALSAGNHALYAGTRLLYTLAEANHGPRFLSLCNSRGTPWVSVILTSCFSLVCLFSDKIGAGIIWSWLLRLVGVSNQIAWISIAISSLRFRRALKVQNKENRLNFKNWTYPWGPILVIVFNIVVLFLQGLESLQPFQFIAFLSYYIEAFLFILTFFYWKFRTCTSIIPLKEMDLEKDCVY